MKFFEVFKTLSVGEELFGLFESMKVLSVTQVKTGNYLRIRLRDGSFDQHIDPPDGRTDPQPGSAGNDVCPDRI